MPRCPKCGMDVSAALGVCGVCQTRLDGTPPPSPAAGASPTAPGAAPVTGFSKAPMVVGLVVWPILALWFGFPVWLLVAVWIGGLLFATVGPAEIASTFQERKKTLVDPVFGEITATLRPKKTRHFWNGKLARPGAAKPLDVSVWAGESGPTELQRAFFQELVRDLATHEAAALEAFRALDRSEWPEAVRTAPLVLAAIDVEDDDESRGGAFSLQFENAAEPEGDYYVDFEDRKVVEAYRLGG